MLYYRIPFLIITTRCTGFFLAHGILHNKAFLTHNSVFAFKAIYSLANNRFPFRLEYSTEWKSALKDAGQPDILWTNTFSRYFEMSLTFYLILWHEDLGNEKLVISKSVPKV